MTTSKGDDPEPPNSKAQDLAAKRAARRTPQAMRNFGLLHAGLAIEHRAITTLHVGSIAHKIALAALSLYPDTRPTESLGRTEIAVRQAIETVVPEAELRQRYEKSIRLACSNVKAALVATYGRAKAEAEASPDFA